MCGIAGAINYQNFDMQKVQDSLYHRGPDEQANCNFENISLVHTRLSIQDIQSGHQPYHYKNYSIVFNGEIYNHINLRDRLREFVFKTSSDTETLLYLFIKYGSKMYELLDGMFAFCILDKSKRKLILGKDRAGKKPLYLYKKDTSLLFASELNAIKAGVKNLTIDEDSIQAYLRCGFFFDKNTAYKDIINLKAGHFYEIDINSLDIKENRYFEIKDYYKPNELSFEESLQKVDQLLHKSVKDRLESSDLEVGAFLSGGIDSSLAVAIASGYKEKLKTFTVKFNGVYDESHLAKLTARKYNTDHHELTISMNLEDDIEKILLNYGQPFMDSSAIPSYYVSLEAKKHVTVILNGDGADELFGGYRRYVPAANNILGIAKIISPLYKIMLKPHSKKSLYNYLYRLLSMARKSGLDYYLSATVDSFEDIYEFGINPLFKDMDAFIKSCEDMDEFSKMLYLDSQMLLFSDLLMKMDIATMSHSLEGRSPFLSKYILEFAPSLKNEYKIKGKSTKHILRELSKKYLPSELITQPKRGFEVPLKRWIENDLKENIFDCLEGSSYTSNFIEKKFISDILNKKINVSDEKRAKMLWTMYCLEVWKKNQ